MHASQCQHSISAARRATCLARLVLVLLSAVASGCTHHQLSRNTALTATTVNTIQYRMVLDNIALFSCEPATLPAHVRLADGTVQISNEAGFGESGGFSALEGTGFGFEQLGPAASTKVSEQWGTDAVEDPIQVRALQTIYRKAFGLPPLEEPNFIIAAKKSRAKNAPGQSEGGTGGSGNGTSEKSGDEQSQSDNQDASFVRQPEVLPAPAQSWAMAGDSASDDSNGSSAREDVDADLDATEFDIPQGWFQIGCKKDVPPNACYVGCYRDRYAWVTADGVDGLAKFTLAVLTITKLEAGESKGGSGLMFTP